MKCEVGPYSVTLVDTPGFDDNSRSDTEILKLIADWLQRSFDKNMLLSGVLYLYDITENRMGGSSMKNIKMFRKLCGDRLTAT